MCFSKIPDEIKNEIMDLSNISATTAESISNLSKEKTNIDAILQIADKIRNGSFGHTKINNFVNKYKKEKINTLPSNTKYYSKNERHLFTVRVDSNDLPSIHFPKDINRLLHSDKTKQKELYEEIQKTIEKKLNIF